MKVPSPRPLSNHKALDDSLNYQQESDESGQSEQSGDSLNYSSAKEESFSPQRDAKEHNDL